MSSKSLLCQDRGSVVVMMKVQFSVLNSSLTVTERDIHLWIVIPLRNTYDRQDGGLRKCALLGTYAYVAQILSPLWTQHLTYRYIPVGFRQIGTACDSVYRGFHKNTCEKATTQKVWKREKLLSKTWNTYEYIGMVMKWLWIRCEECHGMNWCSSALKLSSTCGVVGESL